MSEVKEYTFSTLAKEHPEVTRNSFLIGLQISAFQVEHYLDDSDMEEITGLNHDQYQNLVLGLYTQDENELNRIVSIANSAFIYMLFAQVTTKEGAVEERPIAGIGSVFSNQRDAIDGMNKIDPKSLFKLKQFDDVEVVNSIYVKEYMDTLSDRVSDN